VTLKTCEHGVALDGACEECADELFGKPEPAPRVTHGYSPAPQFPTRGNLALVPSSAPPVLEKLPDADFLADGQHLGGMLRLALDTSTFPRFPWPDVDALTSPLGPEDLLFVLARTGQGKSLLCMNTLDALVESQGKRCLYIGTEQNPEVLRIKWACLREGVSTRLALKARKEERETTDYRLAMERLAAGMEPLRRYGRDKLACFATSRYINAAELNRWVRGAVKQYGTEIVFIDHIDEVDHGDGRNSRHENTQTLNLIQQLNKELAIPFIIASQSKRLAEKSMRFTPPDLEDLAENANKERKSTMVLGVWRPLRVGISDKEIKAVKLGQADENTLFEPDTMGVKLLKNREDTGELGRQCRLRVYRGRLEHIPEKDRAAREHGIRTGGVL
jgi:KaiC/GvpD/RAD55 family RecA-like ATPase